MTVHRTRVVSVEKCCEKVIRLELERPEGCVWKTGQFARIALPDFVVDGEPVWRCYSIGSAGGCETLVFYVALVKDGQLSPRLHALSVGDTVLLDDEMNGMLLEERLEAGGRDLWLSDTDTGVASFLAVTQDETIMSKYEHVVLVHGVSHWVETEYVTKFAVPHDNLSVVVCVTRDAGSLIQMRIPEALTSGKLEETTGLTIDPTVSRAMICGNPAMAKAVRETLKTRGMVTPRGGKPGQLLVENFWL